MTNEEKAKEIGNMCETCFTDRKAYNCQFNCTNKGKYLGSLEMAEWKDKEFSTKTREWFQINAWAFAHSVDGEPDYDDESALQSFMKYVGLED